MADMKISELTEATSAGATDVLPIVQSATTKKIQVANLVTDASIVLTDVTTNDVSTSKHGFAPKAPNDTTKFLRGDGTWATGGTAFWTDVAGTPTRVSDTQFTITDTSNANKYDLLFKKGVVLRWLESTTVNIAMVISSSYGTNTVTVNIVGDSLTAGFTSMKYAGQNASFETFIIPGTLATGTDLAKTWYVMQGVMLLSADCYVKTAGTTNATTFDINDDGTTRFTTKPNIASGATSGIDFVADTPTTEVTAGSLVTIDIDAVSTTAPVEAYIRVAYITSNFLYRN